MGFDHEKLDAYRLAVDFVERADRVVNELPRGRRYLADQLQRASLSIVLNIAEGAGKFSPADKASYYTRARGSCSECAGVLDVCCKLRILTRTRADAEKAFLARIGQMLTKLIKSRQPERRNTDPKEMRELQPGREPEREPEREPGLSADMGLGEDFSDTTERDQ